MFIRSVFKGVLSLVMAVPATACLSIDQKTPVTPFGSECQFDRYRLNADHTPYPEKDIYEATRSAFENETTPRPLLFLSGGSLNGAFGAGVLEGWAYKRGGNLPDFSVVTGVSTGALLSLAAFANTPAAAREGYEIDHESEAINLLINYNGRSLTAANYLEALEAGGISDLGPLKQSVRLILHDPRYNMLDRIIERARTGRKLYTGVVDLDTGEAVALDMSEMALRIGQYPIGSQARGHYTDCFIRAVAASSSVPMAARPITIDNRLYIDGGARFLIFTDKIGPIIQPQPVRTGDPNYQPEPLPKRQIYMVINGRQKITPECQKVDPQQCSEGYDMWTETGEREDWNLVELALRSIDILKTQVKEFSAQAVNIRAEQDPNSHLNPIKINEEDGEHVFVYEGVARTCNEWRKIDKQVDGSLQFHKRYMRCMIDLGKRRVLTNQDWY